MVRCLKVIEMEEPGAKALIFSAWNSLLDVVAAALKENSIVYRQLSGASKSGRKYEQSLSR